MRTEMRNVNPFVYAGGGSNLNMNMNEIIKMTNSSLVICIQNIKRAISSTARIKANHSNSKN